MKQERAMPRMTKREWRVILDCLIFQECNDRDGRPWGQSNDNELTDKMRDKMDAAMETAIEKIKNAREDQ
jgi:hypothetical protein